MNSYLNVLKKYAVFRGRTGRREFWTFLLWHVIIMFIIAFLEGAIDVSVLGDSFGLVTGLYFAATFLPYLAAMVRRLHDTSRSGWWLLINIVPVFGGLILLIFMALDSYPGENKYGVKPK